MSNEELRGLFAGWRELARLDFWRNVATDPLEVAKLVALVALVFAVDVLKLIFMTPETRARLRND